MGDLGAGQASMEHRLGCVAAVPLRPKHGDALSISASIGRHQPDLQWRCRGFSEAAMETDPEMAAWRGRATGVLQWLSGVTAELTPPFVAGTFQIGCFDL